MFTSVEDYFNVTSLIGEALEEELFTLEFNTQQTSFILDIGGAGYRDSLLVDRHCKEIQLEKENVCDLMPQHDMYLQEVKKDFVSLTKMGDALSSFKLPGSLVYQLKLLERKVETNGSMVS